MPYSALQPSFAAGEIAPGYYQRSDLAKYSVGAKKIQNMYVLPSGGIQSRTGTFLVNEVKTSAHRTRMLSFVFNNEQAYIIEAGAHYKRFYTEGGVIVKTVADTLPWAIGTTYGVASFVKYNNVIYRSLQSTNVGHQPDSSPTWWVADATYEIYSPYTIDDTWTLATEQSGDTLYVTHKDYMTRKLTRTGHAAWTISECAFTNGPLAAENTTATTITLSLAAPSVWILNGDTTVTATASTGIFDADYIGSTWGIRYVSHAASYTDTIPALTDYTSASYRAYGDWEIIINPEAGGIDEGDIYIDKSLDGGTTWFSIKIIAKTTDTSNITITGSDSDACLLRIRRPDPTAAFNDSAVIVVNVKGKQSWATFKMTAFTSTTVMTATMMCDFSQGGTAFKTWAKPAWSDVDGWPSTASFYQNRLVFGNSPSEPYGYWASVTDDYENMLVSIPQVSDDAIKDRLVGRKVNEIKYFVPMQELLAFTTDSEWTIGPGTDGILAYNSRRNKQQTYWGCASVPPLVAGNTVLFIQRGATKVIGYTFDTDGYRTAESDLSILASHLLDGYTIIDWAYQQIPYPIVWVVRSDGMLLSFTFHREHDVWAWCRHDTDGSFEAVCVLPGTTTDSVYFLVNRTIGGVTRRFIEMLADRDVSDRDNFHGVDCGVYHSGTSITALTGLDHLEGETVTVLADGSLYTKVVSGGRVILNAAATEVHAGLPFTWELNTLPPDVSSKQSGNSIDKKKNIPRVTICVKDSYGGQIGTLNKDGDIEQPSRIEYGNETALNTQEIDVPILAEWDAGGSFAVTGNGAYPMHITAVIPRITVGG
jgi:hypothetical protein